MGMSKNDDVLAAKLFRIFRNRIAIALHRGQCKVINYLILLPWYGEEQWSQVVDTSKVDVEEE